MRSVSHLLARVLRTILGLGVASALAILLLKGAWIGGGAPAAQGEPYDAEGRPRFPVPRPDRQPNLVVILLDTLSWEAARTHMPSMDALAAQGVSFTQASVPSPWTKPSVASLLTGLLPSDHGAVDSRRPPQLPGAIPTFAEILSRSYGYETVAWLESLPGWFGMPGAALLQGFDHVAAGYSLQATEPLLGRWATQRNPQRPFFLLLHSYDVHDPYGAGNHPWPAVRGPPARPLDEVVADASPRELTRTFLLDRSGREALGDRRFVRSVVRYMNGEEEGGLDPDLVDELKAAYLDGVSWADGHLARTLDLLGAWGLMEDTLVVVTSDHGEAFGEHGHLGHGRILYDEVLRIPLVMRGPAPFSGGRVVEESVGLIDVMPTFFDLAGLRPPHAIAGRSLLPVLGGASAGHPVLAEEVLSEGNTGREIEAVRHSVRTASWKYVLTYDHVTGSLEEELYDLGADPGEQTNLVGDGGRGGAPDAAFREAVRGLFERLFGVAGGPLRSGFESSYGSSLTTIGAAVTAPIHGEPVLR